MIQQKKKSLGNSDDRAHQIAGQNDDNTLGILKANLELKLMFTIHMFIMQGGREQHRVCKFLFLIRALVKTNSNLMCGSLCFNIPNIKYQIKQKE